MHTSQVSRCAPDSAEQLIEAFLEKGYHAVIVTDHFAGERDDLKALTWEEKMHYQARGYEAALKAAEGTGLRVFFGWEMSEERAEDYLTYGLGMDFLLAHPDLEKMPLEEYCRVCHEAGAFITRAHPYRHADYIPPNPTINGAVIDAVEVVNGKWLDPDNENHLAFEWARKHPEKIRTSGTDIHQASVAGDAGIALTHPVNSLEEIIGALRNREHFLIIDGRICDQEGRIVEENA